MPKKWSDYDKYLTGKHLQGRTVALTIAEVVEEEVYSQSERGKVWVPVMYFSETKKGLILTPTNQDKLETLFGDDIAACLGKRVTLEPQTMRVGPHDRTVARIAGRAPDKAAKPTPATEQTPTTTEQPTEA